MKKSFFNLTMLAIMIFMLSICNSFADDEATTEPSEWEKAQAEIAIQLERDRLNLDREKWEWEKMRIEKEEYEKQYSGLIDIKRKIPVFKMYSSLGDFDRRALRNDLSILLEKGINHIIVNMNTGGGDAFSGLCLSDVLSDFQKLGMTIEIRAEGIIASAAVPVFASGTKGLRRCSPNTIFMVHEASIWSFSFGFSQETHSAIKAKNLMMETLRDKYLKLMESHTNMDYDFWGSLEKETTWFTAEKAKEWGLVDIIE